MWMFTWLGVDADTAEVAGGASVWRPTDLNFVSCDRYNNLPFLRRWMRLFEVECSRHMEDTQWAPMTEQLKQNCLLYTQLMQIQAKNLKQ